MLSCFYVMAECTNHIHFPYNTIIAEVANWRIHQLLQYYCVFMFFDHSHIYTVLLEGYLVYGTGGSKLTQNILALRISIHGSLWRNETNPSIEILFVDQALVVGQAMEVSIIVIITYLIAITDWFYSWKFKL